MKCIQLMDHPVVKLWKSSFNVISWILHGKGEFETENAKSAEYVLLRLNDKEKSVHKTDKSNKIVIWTNADLD